MESPVEVDDAELERYLGGETIRPARAAPLLRGGDEPRPRGADPVHGSAPTEVGVDDLLHILVEEAPAARERRARAGLRQGPAT